MKKKILFVVLSGLADDSETTPLMMTSKPNIDLVTRNGVAGLVENNEGEHPDSGISNFVLLGYPKEEYPGRGYLEAMGANIRIIPGSVYIRADFATVKEVMQDDYKMGNFEPRLIVTERRAGRDSTGLLEMSKAIKEFFLDGVRIDFYKSVGHRGVVALNSIDVSADVSDSDPCENGKEVLQIRPLRDDNNAFKTATALNKFSKETYRILKEHPENKYRKFPANYILLRDASVYKHVKPFKEKFGLNAACVAASPVIKGIARAMEIQVENVSGATADLKTDLRAKVMKAIELLSTNDFVILHILGCDITSHEKNPKLGSVFLEKIDREVFGRILEYVNFDKTTLVLASDHPTSSKTGTHMKGKMPFLIYTRGLKPNSVQKLDEISCREGPLIDIENFMEEVVKYTQ
jgi:2,3-bisphosphoglycerate-independent phosphoglycerate mutase